MIKKQKPVTLEDLARMVQNGFKEIGDTVATKKDLLELKDSLETRIDSLEVKEVKDLKVRMDRVEKKLGLAL